MFAKKCLFGSETWHHLRLAPEEWNNEPLLSAVQLCPSLLNPPVTVGLSQCSVGHHVSLSFQLQGVF